MKAVFVESLNGYLAHGANDDMMWTPPMDKKIFKLLSYAFGGVYICSKRTYDLLPEKMRQDKSREFIVAGKFGNKTLNALNQKYPNGVLVGGPKFMMSAYDIGVIDTFIVTTVKKPIVSMDEYKNPFSDVLAKLGASCEIEFNDMIVRVYKNNSQSR